MTCNCLAMHGLASVALSLSLSLSGLQSFSLALSGHREQLFEFGSFSYVQDPCWSYLIGLHSTLQHADGWKVLCIVACTAVTCVLFWLLCGFSIQIQPWYMQKLIYVIRIRQIVFRGLLTQDFTKWTRQQIALKKNALQSPHQQDRF